MLIYHTSTIEIPSPDIYHSRENLDFGKGFYATVLREQAEKYGDRFLLRGKPAVLNVYNFELPEKAVIKEFKSYDDEWLDFVLACRSGKELYKMYDIVMGGIADDRIFNTIDLYSSNQITREEALKRLKYEKPNQQICFIKQMVIDKFVRFRESQLL